MTYRFQSADGANAAGQGAYATRAQVKRMVDAARDAGIHVGGFECTRDGTIRVLTEISVGPTERDYDDWKQAGTAG